MPIHTFADFKKKNSYNNNNNKYKKKKPNPPSKEVKNAPCTRCGRSTHLASSCTNTTHIDGSKIAKVRFFLRTYTDGEARVQALLAAAAAAF